MTFGLQTINDDGILNIDENLRTYVYLGKHLIYPGGTVGVGDGPNQDGYSVWVDFICVGRPLVFMSLPSFDPFVGGTGGIVLVGVSAIGPNLWRAQFAGDVAREGSQYMRVFGVLDLNFPGGTGNLWGMQVWNAAGELVFDTGAPMLQLSGFTGGSLITVPNDSSTFLDIPVGVSLAGKSVGAISLPRRGEFTDEGPVFDGDGEIVLYQVFMKSLAYRADVTSILRFIDNAVFQDEFIGTGPFGTYFYGGTVTVPLNIIDNAQFP